MEQEFWKNLNKHSQRILSQIDRDPDSPTYGCFDRNFWNYKIRDFASIIQQQGILVLDVLYSYKSTENPYHQSKVIYNLIRAGINFWSHSQLRTGAFNEYYPYESGFPPTAFSLYTVSLILQKYPEFKSDNIIKSIEKASRWLLKHPEREALNQESAALAGMVIASNIEGAKIDNKKLEKRLSLFYKSQSPEGWFNEYGGPDLGYLSVTIDSLWDIYKYSGDERAKKAALKATEFISCFSTVSGDFPVMINARNTDYIVPYGMSCLAQESEHAARVVKTLHENMNTADGMFGKTDDRYMTHYVGQSWFRSILELPAIEAILRKKQENQQYTNYFTDCRIFVAHDTSKSVIISLGKGGIVSEYDANGIARTDFGWRIRTGKKVAVTHWQNSEYQCEYQKESEEFRMKVKGQFSEHGFIRPSPLKHMVLRISAFLLGNTLMAPLKSLLIFNQKKFPLSFERTIILKEGSVDIEDQFSERADNFKLYKAPHYSMRHVSSAGRFVIEELIVPK